MEKPHNRLLQSGNRFHALNKIPFLSRFGDTIESALSVVASAVFVYYLGLGCIVATGAWLVANKLLHRRHPHPHSTGVDQNIEWLFAFDVHCNAVVSMLALLGGTCDGLSFHYTS